MRILFYLGHPAHFHLFRNVMKNLKKNNHEVTILIRKKDVLEDLLKEDGFNYKNVLINGRKDNKLGLIYGSTKQYLNLLFFCLRNRQDLLVGTPFLIAHVGKILNIPSINVNEDDAEVVPMYAKLAYPWTSVIIAPNVCSVGKWEHKKIGYSGYHELAYLHPNNFRPKKEIVEKYFSTTKKYFIIRLAKLTAHHDKGVSGINREIVSKLIKLLKGHGEVYITSERELEEEFEKYRISIKSIDMHHVLAFATLYIGDSQTMAAEAGVLGVPFIRYNDFVGKIGYLNELENKYNLGYGVKTKEEEKLYLISEELINDHSLNEKFQKRRIKMLKDKIDFASFLTWFIESYPKSKRIMQENPQYQSNFM